MEKAMYEPAIGAKDAISILTEDHENVARMFTEFEELVTLGGSDEEKSTLVEKICEELNVHTQIEEEIFYPAVRAAIDDDDLMDEAEEEHADAKELIAQLEDMQPGDEDFDGRVAMLAKSIDHHVGEEQEEMFPKARRVNLDLSALGTQMLERRRELLAYSGAAAATATTKVA